jgi:hypothetical protein
LALQEGIPSHCGVGQACTHGGGGTRGAGGVRPAPSAPRRADPASGHGAEAGGARRRQFDAVPLALRRPAGSNAAVLARQRFGFARRVATGRVGSVGSSGIGAARADAAARVTEAEAGS